MPKRGIELLGPSAASAMLDYMEPASCDDLSSDMRQCPKGAKRMPLVGVDTTTTRGRGNSRCILLYATWIMLTG